MGTKLKLEIYTLPVHYSPNRWKDLPTFTHLLIFQVFAQVTAYLINVCSGNFQLESEKEKSISPDDYA